MKCLILYESAHGNTERIARAIGASIQGEVQVMRVSEGGDKISGVQVLIVGAPTYGGKAMPPVQEFLERIPEGTLKGIRTAAFDTRLKSRFAAVFGFAAPKIAAALEAKGGTPFIGPEGFIVKATKGPLVEGEEERAAAWGKTISGKLAAA